jgi:alkanesulfonate monooxygenase SsuD/methylene tetrahydromethanopterin reductase-like flavin-dependent oxidoreductase (luciferase family)
MPDVEVGIALPTRELALLGAVDAVPLVKIARQVEELGYDGIWAGDSFVARHRLEPLTLLTAVAMVTDHVTVGTAALTVVNREPVSLAHSIVTLDQLSGGRLRMALGTGAPLPVQAEYDAVTMSYRERRERVDEVVAAWRRAWNNEDGDLRGTYYDLSRLREQPPPLQPGGPELWLASNGKPRAAARIGRLYDGWMPILPTPAQYAAYWRGIRDAVGAAGRDPRAVTPCVYATVTINPDARQAREGLEDYTHRYNDLPLTAMEAYQLYFGGSARALAGWLTEYVRAGARLVVLRIGAFENYAQHLRAIADEVVPALHALDAG